MPPMIKKNKTREYSDEQKTQIMNRILEAWKKVPHIRFGQFIYCVFVNEDFFSYDDEMMTERFERFAGRNSLGDKDES